MKRVNDGETSPINHGSLTAMDLKSFPFSDSCSIVIIQQKHPLAGKNKWTYEYLFLYMCFTDLRFFHWNHKGKALLWQEACSAVFLQSTTLQRANLLHPKR